MWFHYRSSDPWAARFRSLLKKNTIAAAVGQRRRSSTAHKSPSTRAVGSSRSGNNTPTKVSVVTSVSRTTSTDNTAEKQALPPDNDQEEEEEIEKNFDVVGDGLAVICDSDDVDDESKNNGESGSPLYPSQQPDHASKEVDPLQSEFATSSTRTPTPGNIFERGTAAMAVQKVSHLLSVPPPAVSMTDATVDVSQDEAELLGRAYCSEAAKEEDGDDDFELLGGVTVEVDSDDSSCDEDMLNML